ncbi:MAG: peptidylprolyl isomerase [Sandaracinaceae bacterium]|nr:peptidylprolyl isomerase [Sandaracinaceae bacterium]
MRSIPILFVLVLSIAGCREAHEPHGVDDRPRLGMARGEAPAEGRALAQPRERVAPAQPAPRVAEPARPAVPPQDVAPHPGNQRAPDTFTARLVTTAGNIDIEVHRAWSPHGADRFYTLVREGFFNDVAFFRVIDGFMAQGGIHGDPNVARQWRDRRIPDDPVVQSNRRGFVSYAMAGPGTRTTQFFVNLVDNNRLDSMGFSPFGQVRDMTAVDALHAGYGEGAPSGRGPNQALIQSEGNAYLRRDFPELSYIRSASIL